MAELQLFDGYICIYTCSALTPPLSVSPSSSPAPPPTILSVIGWTLGRGVLPPLVFFEGYDPLVVSGPCSWCIQGVEHR